MNATKYSFLLFLLLLVMARAVTPTSVTSRITKMAELISVLNYNAANEFRLTDQEGQISTYHSCAAKSFCFSSATHTVPTLVPTTMSKLSRVNKVIGNDSKDVVTLFISLDPDRDTPAVLKTYLAYFHLNSIGLTGTKDQIDKVVNQYGARYEIEQSDSAAGIMSIIQLTCIC